MEKDLLWTLQKSRDPAVLEETGALLRAAGIPHRLLREARHFEITEPGKGPAPEQSLLIRQGDYARARAAMEADALQYDLPEGHYLLSAKEHEIASVIATADDWSASDVAHARRLVAELGIDPNQIQTQSEERQKALERGRPAPVWLVALGWSLAVFGLVFSVFGSACGIGIGWSLWRMLHQTPNGRFFRYDEASRRSGVRIFSVALGTFALGVFFLLLNFSGAMRP